MVADQSYQEISDLKSAARRSGHIRTVGGGNPAADDTTANLEHGPRRPTSRLTLDHSPGRAISKQSRQDGVVELVAATYRAIGAQQRHSGQGQISDHVEHLVANALVGVTEALGIEQPLLVEYDGVLER